MLASARAFVFYFNTERRAVYCVLYVFLFILYNTVFFITQPCGRPVRPVFVVKPRICSG